jgi:hypothetical protein
METDRPDRETRRDVRREMRQERRERPRGRASIINDLHKTARKG